MQGLKVIKPGEQVGDAAHPKQYSPVVHAVFLSLKYQKNQQMIA